MKNNNVAFLFAPGSFGGAEKIVLHGAKELRARLWLLKETRRPEFCDDFQKKAERLNISVEVFSCAGRFDLKTLLTLKQKAAEVDIVHSHGLKANVYGAFLPGLKVGAQHGKTSHNWRCRLYEALEERAFLKMDAFVGVSEEIVAASGHPKRFLIENFLLIQDQEMPERHKTVRSSPERIRLLFAGRLSKEKGAQDLLKAMEMLPPGVKEKVSLTVAGEGRQAAALKLLARRNPAVTFAGFVPNITAKMSRFDALVLPSRREGMPLAALEAAALGVPLLASSVGALPVLVKDNGTLFAPEDPRNLADAISKFCANRDAFARAAKKKAKQVREIHSPRRWARKHRRVYDMLLKRP